jgi:hypothetical protein
LKHREHQLNKLQRKYLDSKEELDRELADKITLPRVRKLSHLKKIEDLAKV